MQRGCFILIFAIHFLTLNVYSQTSVTFSGTVIDSVSGQVINDVTLVSLKNGAEIKTNSYGFFSYRLTKNVHEDIYFYKEGYSSKIISMTTSRDSFQTISLGAYILPLVTIVGDSLMNNSLIQSQTHAIVITEEKLNKLPLLLGEKDIVRSLQFFPGVQSSNEASSGIYVRGGSADQNLFILDDVPVYNINHLFGFVSVFNPDIVKEATFYKGDFPARYGGKLSSVIDIKSKDGSDKKFGGDFAISPVTSKMRIDGPLKKGKISYSLAARRTFMDFFSSQILHDLTDYDLFNFYDVNLKLKFLLDEKNRIYLSAYNGKDSFRGVNSGTEKSSLGWGNTGMSLRWNHIISNSVFQNTTLVYSNYKFLSEQSSSTDGGANIYSISYSSLMKALTGKTDIDWLIKNNLSIRGGMGFTSYRVQPGITEQINDTTRTFVNYDYKPNEFNWYLESKIDLSLKLHLMLGVREDFFNTDFDYQLLQPRIALDFDITRHSSFRLAYSKTFQPMHQLSNTSLGLPSELWVPSLNNLGPENASLFSAGSIIHAPHGMTVSIDGYYKKMENIIDYKPGSKFLSLSQDISKNVIPDWTQNVAQGSGEAYGGEFMIEKGRGQFTGWFSYTISWSTRKFDDINFGKMFYTSFDRRHNISIVLGYKFNRTQAKRNDIVVSATWQYASANPVTLPSGNVTIVTFSQHGYVFGSITEYNSYIRIKSFHRLDLAIRLTRQKDKRRIWEFGIYNVYNRANPFYYYLSYDYDSKGRYVSLKQKSYFPILPYISYEIKF